MPKQQRAPMIPPVTAVDELGTIKEALILSLLLTVFDRDTKVLKESKLKTKQPYIDLLQRAMDAVTADLAKHRNRLREKGIKMTDERRDKDGVGCVYWCRGYRASFEMLWHFAKAETEVRMRKYLGEDIRKYVRGDLPDHLKPQWLLDPVTKRKATPPARRIPARYLERLPLRENSCTRASTPTQTSAADSARKNQSPLPSPK